MTFGFLLRIMSFGQNIVMMIFAALDHKNQL